MSYQVIDDTDLNDLVTSINALVATGWVLVGTIFTTLIGATLTYRAVMKNVGLIDEYKVVTAWTQQDLKTLVEAEITAGWELQGGIASQPVKWRGRRTDGEEPDLIFAQALVKRI